MYKKFPEARWGLLVVFIFIVVGYLATDASISIYKDNNPAPLASEAESGMVFITLTPRGFEPEEVVIKKGTTVMFNSTTGKPFWPASNLHPSHEIYPAFDPEGPIAFDQTWSFTFDRVGIWDMHDHIRSYFTGSIIVVD